MAVNTARDLPKAVAAAAIVALAILPMAKMPAFYEFLHLSHLLLGLAVDELGAAQRLCRLLQPGPRRLLRSRRLYDGGAHDQVRRALPRHRAGRGRLGRAAGGRHRRRRVPPAPAARRAVRAAHPRGDLRHRHHHPQHADRRRRRRVHERRAAARPDADADRHDLHPGLRDVRAHARHGVVGRSCAARPGPVRHPRRRGCGRGQGRADLPLQDRGLRAVGRHRRRRGRHPCHVCRLHHRGRHVRAHRGSLCRADERAGRGAPLAGAGDRRHRHHRLALRLHQRRRGDHGSRHRRPDPDRRHPVAARWRHPRHPGLAEASPCRACDDTSGSGPGRSGGGTDRSASARSCR